MNVSQKYWNICFLLVTTFCLWGAYRSFEQSKEQTARILASVEAEKKAKEVKAAQTAALIKKANKVKKTVAKTAVAKTAPSSKARSIASEPAPKAKPAKQAREIPRMLPKKTVKTVQAAHRPAISRAIASQKTR
ncbi:MAG TPA: hypothetical protein VM432_05095 [Bdellovibrionales bacterium]|nr:hypothetical protein [Bdellovibrionales bacterium]